MGIPIDEYKTALMKHDWWHELSTNNDVFERGAKEERRLKKASTTSDEHRKAWYHALRVYKHKEPVQ